MKISFAHLTAEQSVWRARAEWRMRIDEVQMTVHNLLGLVRTCTKEQQEIFFKRVDMVRTLLQPLYLVQVPINV